jgi:hypothetical protein
MVDFENVVEGALVLGMILGVMNLAYGLAVGVFSLWLALLAGFSGVAVAVLYVIHSLTFTSRILFREADGRTIEFYGKTLGKNWSPGSWAFGVWTWRKDDE